MPPNGNPVSSVVTQPATTKRRLPGLIFAGLGFISSLTYWFLTQRLFDIEKALREHQDDQFILLQPAFFVIILALGILAVRRRAKLEGILLILLSLIGLVPAYGGLAVGWAALILAVLIGLFRLIRYVVTKIHFGQNRHTIVFALTHVNDRWGAILFWVGVVCLVLAYLGVAIIFSIFDRHSSQIFDLTFLLPGVLGVLTIICGILACVNQKARAKGWPLIISGLVAANPFIGFLLLPVPVLVFGISSVVQSAGQLKIASVGSPEKVKAKYSLVARLVLWIIAIIISAAFSLTLMSGLGVEP